MPLFDAGTFLIKDIKQFNEYYWVLGVKTGSAYGDTSLNYIRKYDPNGGYVADSELLVHTDELNQEQEGQSKDTTLWGEMVEMPGSIVACLFEDLFQYVYTLIDKNDYKILGSGVVEERDSATTGSNSQYGISGSPRGDKQLVVLTGASGSTMRSKWNVAE